MQKLTLLLFLSIIACTGIRAQDRLLKGKVLDAENKAPLALVSVRVIGENTSRTTADDGTFSISVKGKPILVISYTGYKTQSINITESQTTLDVLLQKETEALGEVVVIGYGKQQKKDVTSAISSISGKKLHCW